ncbi:TPA: hypothetical protein NEG33_004805 [Klebsiella pneumoniae]|uniref:hypothetical protein n=1 Tax=Enterobacteriaceae TaxID=543 RepID=UPI00073B8FF4|nr:MULTISPECIES: hypothetical protein [Enterobacteriaceae]AWX81989.1 hypothetical protein DQB71_11470 [Klebsiella pneumoniae subsp. pneumoniae]EKV3540804.1 hypothetical protein [Klebsiella pneumoniae]EKW3991449.1 hypothetical protein [Klebsiella pneumoniae]EKX2632761.1 hypothetical protein [Klebsiella pneumoniae]ELP1309356.1 hypothetical protein [Escherichia coli]
MAEDKVLQVRYTRCGKQFEKSIAWDGCDPVGSTLGCIVEEHNLANLISGQERAEFGGIRNLRKPINLLEHGIDDVFFFDEEINNWQEISLDWLTDA